MWDYKRFEELQKFLGTPPPFDKGLREIIDFLLLPPSYRSTSYKAERPFVSMDDMGAWIKNALTPLPSKVFCDKLRELKPGEFVIIVADLLRKLGGEVVIGPKGADGAIDVLWRTPEGDYIVQCKRWGESKSGKIKKVGVQIAREVYGALTELTPDNAIWFITDLSLRVGLIDGKKLFNLMSLQMPTVVEDIREGRWKSRK